MVLLLLFLPLEFFVSARTLIAVKLPTPNLGGSGNKSKCG